MPADRVRGSVLVVDDEPTIAEIVARYLERAGYDARIAHDGPAALAAWDERAADLVVLDLMLPGFDGLEVMRRIRSAERDRTGIILLTARDKESDRIVGLRLGADDYVVKPFSVAELVARVDAVLRRVDTSPAAEPPLDVRRARDRPDRPPRDAARRRGPPDAAGVRAAAVPRAPSRPGVLPPPADGPRLAPRLHLRHLDGHRRTSAGCARSWRTTRRARAGSRRSGASATGSSHEERAARGRRRAARDGGGSRDRPTAGTPPPRCCGTSCR